MLFYIACFIKKVGCTKCTTLTSLHFLLNWFYIDASDLMINPEQDLLFLINRSIKTSNDLFRSNVASNWIPIKCIRISLYAICWREKQGRILTLLRSRVPWFFRSSHLQIIVLRWTKFKFPCLPFLSWEVLEKPIKASKTTTHCKIFIYCSFVQDAFNN